MSVVTYNRNELLLITILRISSMNAQGTDFVPGRTLWQRYVLARPIAERMRQRIYILPLQWEIVPVHGAKE